MSSLGIKVLKELKRSKMFLCSLITMFWFTSSYALEILSISKHSQALLPPLPLEGPSERIVKEFFLLLDSFQECKCTCMRNFLGGSKVFSFLLLFLGVKGSIFTSEPTFATILPLLFDLKKRVFFCLNFIPPSQILPLLFLHFAMRNHFILHEIPQVLFFVCGQIFVHHIPSYGDEFFKNCFFFLLLFSFVLSFYLRMHLLHHAWCWLFRSHYALRWCLKNFQKFKELAQLPNFTSRFNPCPCLRQHSSLNN